MLLNDVTPDCLEVSQDGGQRATGTGVHVELTSDYRPVDVVTVRWVHIKSLHGGRMEGWCEIIGKKVKEFR